MEKPTAVVLDVNETLFALDALAPVFVDLGMPDSVDLWFARTLRSGFALTCLGEYRPFPEVAKGALESLKPGHVTSDDVAALMDAFGRLRPHPEVREALARLHAAGVPVVTLTVGNAANVERLFESAGLDGGVLAHLSCADVQRWKPAPEPYRYACQRLGVEPADAWMVAAHPWDLAGAKAVGMQTAWVSRLEGVFDGNFGAPDVVGADLMGVVDALGCL